MSGPAEAPAARIGVFGGTFDPVHNGHLAMAMAALEALPLDRVIFVPARRSPLKGAAPSGSAEDRVSMLELAIGDQPRFALSRAELERPEPSYTVDTLEALAGEGQLFLILGSDAASEMQRWKRPERVRELARLVVARRPGSEDAGTADILLGAPLMDVSSRDLRARAAAGRSLRYLVPDGVWRYIEEHGLYSGTSPSTAS